MNLKRMHVWGYVFLLGLFLFAGTVAALKEKKFVVTADPGPGLISQATSGPPRAGKTATEFLLAEDLKTPAQREKLGLGAEIGPPDITANRFRATANPGPGFISLATSGPPLEVSSTGRVANLNADLLDNLDASAFAAAVHGHDVSEITGAATLGANSFSGDQSVTGTVTATAFVGDGSGLTNIQSSQIAGPNPLQIALLRWYAANESGASFAVGTGPIAVAFDGANIWVANNGSNTVTKLRASDGFNLGTFPAGNGPGGVAFDGANIWVANQPSNTVTKLRASDGANLGTFVVGSVPVGVAFDGANVWVVNVGSNNVTKLRASDGFNLGTFPVSSFPYWVAFDGANIWVTNNGSNTVTKLRASDGATLGEFAVGSQPEEVAFDGANIWVANYGANTVTKLRASDGANLGTFAVGSFPWGVAFDGANIWVANVGSNNVTKLRASDGANLGTFAVGSFPYGVAFDGANIWVTNASSGNVSKL